MAELNFYWRMGDYALEAVPKRLVRCGDEPNETIDLVKYCQYQGRECKYSIGYFWYNEHEPCWELKFVGDRFKELRKTDLVAVFEMLTAAYDTLEAWQMASDCAISIIQEAPAADVAPVVRCKDCKNYRLLKNRFGVERSRCMLIGADVGSEAFCSYGERRRTDGT